MTLSKEVGVIWYLIQKMNELWVSDLYQTKFYKILFYIDFLHYKRLENSITNNTYFKLPYWPVPIAIKEKIDLMKSPSALEDLSDFLQLTQDSESSTIWKNIEEYKSVISLNSEDNKYIIQLSQDASKLDFSSFLLPEERETIDMIVQTLWIKNVKDVVELSHKEEAYKATDMYEPIFYWYAKNLSI